MRLMPIEPEEPAATAMALGVMESAEEKKEWMQEKLLQQLKDFESHPGSMRPHTGSLTSSSGARTPQSDEEVVGSNAYA
jgi:hypothetical protein